MSDNTQATKDTVQDVTNTVKDAAHDVKNDVKVLRTTSRRRQRHRPRCE